VLRQLPARLGKDFVHERTQATHEIHGLRVQRDCNGTDSGHDRRRKRLHHFRAGRRFSRLGPERFDALQVQSPPPGELEKTVRAQQTIESVVANSGEENTAKLTERRGPPLSYLVLSTTSEAQLRTKHEQSSIRDARIILQNYP
jgi:hypothetical protein